MSVHKITALIAMLAVSLVGVAPAAADPCGMVPPPPPIEIATSSTIERIGVQKTYVAHDRGIETMVLRPGFSGNVEEFGMLIPFPSPPAIRKVDDNIFSHIAAAIDPPEVIARVQRFRPRPRRSRAMMGAGMAKSSAAPAAERELAFDEVRVVKQQAVGMYEIATIAAGSSVALSRWMKDNNFRYPEGMDDVVDDYVKSKWFFVAVKTRVGDKANVNPRPGMRSANAKRVGNTQFSGFVQAMGFRFRTRDLVIPMRLSVFNTAGDARNIVYALTDNPSKIKGIPESYVMRQLPGKRLRDNVENPLPLRVIGGTKKDLAAFQLAQLKTRRDPTPHNGLAKELFGSDMLAMSRGKLSNPLEDKETELHNISEALDLRGPQIDELQRNALKKEKERLATRSLQRLDRMTLTVIDGSFDKKLLAKQNLRFERFRMARAKNNKQGYDAIRQGPGFNQGGKLYLWELSYDDIKKDGSSATESGDQSFTPAWAFGGTGSGSGPGGNTPMIALAALAALAMAEALRRRHKLAVAAALALLLAMPTQAVAQGSSSLAAKLGGKKGEAAMERLVQEGSSALPGLMAVAIDSKNELAQGRAVLAMVRIGGAPAKSGLESISNSTKTSMLVRTWAAAGRMQAAESMNELRSLERLSRQFPAARRSWTKSMGRQLRGAKADELFDAMARIPELRQELQAQLQGLSSAELIDTMLHATNQNARAQAAGLMGNKPATDLRLLRDALRFDKSADAVPWNGGPLYLPGVEWTNKLARSAAADLIRWMIWSEEKGDAANARIAANNLAAPILANAVGYEIPNRAQMLSTDHWVETWTKTFGKNGTKKLLAPLK